MIRLVKPSIKYRLSYLRALKEFHREGRNKKIPLDQSKKEFKKFVINQKNKAKGIGVSKGYVPASIYWLAKGNAFIGKISIRHRFTPFLKREGGHIGYEIRPSERHNGYGTKILALGLRKAHQLNLRKVLLTCNADNIGSRKVIEKNGGIFENKIRAKTGQIKLRYWIKV